MVYILDKWKTNELKESCILRLFFSSFFKNYYLFDLKILVNGIKDESNVRAVDKILFVYLENTGLEWDLWGEVMKIKRRKYLTDKKMKGAKWKVSKAKKKRICDIVAL